MLSIADRYQPTGEVLHGGMSDVYICKDALLDRIVIVKSIGDPSQLHRVIDEIKALQRLRSKHVVQIYDYFVDSESQQIGIVEEFVPGPSLQEFPPAGSPLSIDDYLLLLYQVASGLADLHEQGIIHRDIKPDNIKRDDGGLVKIIDFGLARFTGINDKTVGFSGTLVYAAPELLKDQPLAFTNAIDVYAFGVLAWHLSGQGIPRELSLIPPRLDSTPSFASLTLDLPDLLVDLLNRTTRLNPAERPKISKIAQTLQAQLLRNKHKGLLVSGDHLFVMSSEKPGALLQIDSTLSIAIRYTGLAFRVAATEGVVSINNCRTRVGDTLPKSCVITLGDAGERRVFATFDISNPEVVL
jgi:eukaryotic-like serine/threonine-protein kinase